MKKEIHSVYDAINIISGGLDDIENCMNQFPSQLKNIYDKKIDPRLILPTCPFPEGLWFRGQFSSNDPLTPAIFRKSENVNNGEKAGAIYDEASLFYEFQFKLPEFKKQYVSTLDWLCFMQHYGLPTRLLDWSENVLVALWFAVNPYSQTKAKDTEGDGALFVLNSIRLNKMSRISNPHLGVAYQTCLDAIIRSEMAPHRRKSTLKDVVTKSCNIAGTTERINARLFDTKEKGIENSLKIVCSKFIAQFNYCGKCETCCDIEDERTWCDKLKMTEPELADDYFRLSLPVSIVPYRVNPRMKSQASTFTLHGGKLYNISNPYSTDSNEMIPIPTELETLNRALSKQAAEAGSSKEIKLYEKFIIPWKYKRKIRNELLTLGIHRGYLFPEPEHEAKWLEGRWKYPTPNIFEDYPQ